MTIGNKLTTNITKNNAIKLAQQIIGNPEKYALVDAETTARSTTDEVIELAIIDGSGKTLFHEFFLPSEAVSEEATKIHHLDIYKLKDRKAKPFTVFADQLIEIFKDRTLVAYNSSFDVRLINQTAKKYGLPLEIDRHICALDLRRSTAEHNQSLKNGGDHSSINDILITLNHIKDIANVPIEETSLEMLVEELEEIKVQISKLLSRKGDIENSLLELLECYDPGKIVIENNYTITKNLSITGAKAIVPIENIPRELLPELKPTGGLVKRAIIAGMDVDKYVTYQKGYNVSIKPPKY